MKRVVEREMGKATPIRASNAFCSVQPKCCRISSTRGLMRILGSSILNMRNGFSISEVTGRIENNFLGVKFSKPAGDAKSVFKAFPRKVHVEFKKVLAHRTVQYVS